MKKLLLLLPVLLLMSCTMTESIRISETGGGQYSLEMDGSQLMEMIPQEQMDRGAETRDLDSTIVFKDLMVKMKDTIAKMSAEEQMKLKALERFMLNVRMKEAEKQMKLTVMGDFGSVAELGTMLKSMEEVQKQGVKGIAQENADKLGDGFGPKADFSYIYDGKKFSRKASAVKVADASLDTEDPYQMIYESSRYVIKYEFAKRVKKVSDPKATFSEDRKTVSVEYPMGEYARNPAISNLEIEFE